jgi:hypothetical protein
MKSLYILLFTVMSTSLVFGQQADSIKKQRQIQSYKQRLGLPDDKAKKVVAVHEQYKLALKKITDDQNLSELEKRKSAEQLMAEKNNKLSALLTTGQLDAVVPTSERQKGNQKRKTTQIVTRRDSVQLRDQMSKALLIPKDKAKQVMFVQLSYKEHSRQLLADSSLTEAVKRSRLNQLIRERNQHLNKLLSPAQVSKIVPQAEQKI